MMTRDEIATAIVSGMAAGHLGLMLTRGQIERAVRYADTLAEVLQETEITKPTLPKEKS